MLNENISQLENVSYSFIAHEDSIGTNAECNQEILEEWKLWNTSAFEEGGANRRSGRVCDLGGIRSGAWSK